MGAIAVVDDMGFYGSVRAYAAARAAGMRALAGFGLRWGEGRRCRCWCPLGRDMRMRAVC